MNTRKFGLKRKGLSLCTINVFCEQDETDVFSVVHGVINTMRNLFDKVHLSLFFRKIGRGRYLGEGSTETTLTIFIAQFFFTFLQGELIFLFIL